MLDAGDIGQFVHEALGNADEFVGETVQLAGDELTLAEMADVLADVVHADVQTVHIPLDVARSEFGDDYADLFEWYNDNPLSGLVAEVRDEYSVDPTPFADYLERSDWATPELPAGADA